MISDDEAFSVPMYRPGSQVPIVFNNRTNERCLANAEWGFIPSWDYGLEYRGKLYNIRVETLLESLSAPGKNRIRASFAKAVQQARGIFPVADFREYSRKDRQLMKVLPAKGQDMLCLAAIYSQVQIPQGGLVTSLGVLTRPDPRFGRFPILLDFGELSDAWLDIGLTESRLLIPRLRQLGYTDRRNYHLPQDEKPCAEQPPDQSLQTRLSLP